MLLLEGGKVAAQEMPKAKIPAREAKRQIYLTSVATCNMYPHKLSTLVQR